MLMGSCLPKYWLYHFVSTSNIEVFDVKALRTLFFREFIHCPGRSCICDISKHKTRTCKCLQSLCLYHTGICKRSFGGEMIHLNKTLNLYKITLSGKYWICGNCGASAWMFTTIWGKVNGEFKVLSWVDYRDQKLTTVDDEWNMDIIM